MSDQIILEFIGDPSGLRPAEEALKGLSKTSQETVEAFNKANAAAKQFAESAKGISTSLKGVETATAGSVKAISGLTQAISGGAVKAMIDDFRKWSAEVTTLSTKKQQLTAQLSKVKDELTRLNGTAGEGTQHYKKLSKEAEILEGKIGRTNKALADHAAKLNDTSRAVKATADSTATAEKKVDTFGESAKKSSTSLQGIISFTREYTEKVGHLAEAIAISEGKESQAIEIKKKTAEALKIISGVQQAVSAAEQIAEEKKTIQAGLSRAAQMLRISSIRDAITAQLASIGIIKTATTAEAAETAAKAEGTVVARTRYTTQLIENAANSQSAIARGIATAAQWGLNAALYAFPVVAIVAGVVALGAALVAAVRWINDNTNAFKVLGQAIDVVIDTARDFAAILTGGLVDSRAIHKHKEDIKQIGQLHEQNSETLKKQITLLEAQGASSESIAAKKREQLQEEKKAIEAQLSIETDVTKQKELHNKLDETDIALIKSKKEGQEAHLQTMRDEGATELQILQEKKKQNDEALKANAQAELQNRNAIALNEKNLAAIKIELEKARVNGTLTSQMISQYIALEAQSEQLKIQSKELEHQGKVLAANNKIVTDDIRKENTTLYDETLQKRKQLADAELAAAKAGSKEELKLHMDKLDREAQASIKSFKGTTQEREKYEKFINEKLKNDKEALTTQYNLKELQEQKTSIETQLKLAEKGSQQEYDLKMQLLAKERETINADTQLSKAQKEKAFTEISIQEDELWSQQLKKAKDTLDQISQAENKKGEITNAQLKKVLESQIANTELELQNEKLSIQEKLDLQNDLLAEKRRLAIADATATITDEKALKEKLKEIDGQYIKDEQVLADNARKEQDQKDEARKKKILDRAKQVGKELIKIAQQVSDAVFENEKQKRDNDLKAKLDNLNAQKDAELLNTTLTASQRNAIEKKYRIEEAREKEKAWKADQKAKAEQAIINGLLAFTAALISSPPPANYINAAIALASAGVQAGIILSKTPPKFAKGVVAIDGPGTETSDSIAAYLSKGESVITAKATKQYAPLLESMNAGTFSNYMPIPQMPNVSDHLQAVHSLSLGEGRGEVDYERLGEAFAKKVNLKQLLVNIDEKGFSKSILSKGNRIESYNDKMKF